MGSCFWTSIFLQKIMRNALIAMAFPTVSEQYIDNKRAR